MPRGNRNPREDEVAREGFLKEKAFKQAVKGETPAKGRVECHPTGETHAEPGGEETLTCSGPVYSQLGVTPSHQCLESF